MTPFTDADRRLLAILQADSRISNQELAERAGMSASACWRGVRALARPAPQALKPTRSAAENDFEKLPM